MRTWKIFSSPQLTQMGLQTIIVRETLARTKAASTLNVAGVEQHDWWAANHPFTQKPVVGVVMVWRPSNAMIIENNSETEDYDDLGF